MPRKKKTETAATEAAATTEITADMSKTLETVATPETDKEAAKEKAAPAKELTTAEKLAARIKAGDEILVLVNHEGLHLLYPKADTPANRAVALRLCAKNSGGKPMTFLNDSVSKD